MTLEEALKRIETLERELDWLRQTVHRAHHDGPLDECPKNTCDAALKALGKRPKTVLFEFARTGEVVELDGENECIRLEVYNRFEGNEVVTIEVSRDALKAVAEADLLYRAVDVTIRLDRAIDEDETEGGEG